MEPVEPFVGSVEIITGDMSHGIPGTSWTPDAVPAVVGPVAGITDLVAVEPEERAKRFPEAQWTGTDANGLSVTVLLWRQLPEDINGPFAEQAGVT